MNRFGFPRLGDESVSRAEVGAAARSTDGQPQELPRAADTLFEIGVVIALHLAVALAVSATLDAVGVR